MTNGAMMSSQPSGGIRFNVWLDAELGYKVVGNFDHVQGVRDSRFIGLVRVFGQVSF